MKKFLIFILIVVVIGAGYYGYQEYMKSRRATEAPEYETVSAVIGDLTSTVGATGTVRANQTAVLTWKTSGTVGEVMVKEGDKVSKGDILAELDDTSLSQSIILAQADLINARQAIEELYDTDLSIARTEQLVVDAKKALEDAQRNLVNLSAKASQADIDAAKANVTLAKDRLDRAKENYKPYENKPESNVIRAALLSKLSEAQNAYDSTVNRLNFLTGSANPTTLAVRESNVLLAKAELADAERRLEDLKAGPDPDDLFVIEVRITAAEATISQSKLTAPFSGVITQVHTKPGDIVSPGSISFRIDDLDTLLVDVQVSEIDINQVIVGQEVSLSFDAILGKEYSGKVINVALVGTSQQGIVDFTVTVELTNYDQQVKGGMTAGVNIIIEKLTGVLLIPNRAVRINEGKRVVYVMKSGNPESVEITLGASSEIISQVLEGDLREGDKIVLNPPAEFQPDPGGFFGGMR